MNEIEKALLTAYVAFLAAHRGKEPQRLYLGHQEFWDLRVSFLEDGFYSAVKDKHSPPEEWHGVKVYEVCTDSALDFV